MESFVKTIENKILEGIKKIGYDTDKVLLSNSTKPEFGQFQFNGVMAIAKRNGKNPVEVANALVDVLKDRLLGHEGYSTGLWYDKPSRRFFSDEAHLDKKFKWDKKEYNSALPYPPPQLVDNSTEVFGEVKRV
jgi:arginyl-tRNA synthetase